jgi:hypothetical protein
VFGREEVRAVGLDFVQAFGGCRLGHYDPQPPLHDPPTDGEERDDKEVNLDYEVPQGKWSAVDPQLPGRWRPGDWSERPVRFVDGKDDGETVAWLRAPDGYPVPIRLSEIGGVELLASNGECRRRFVAVERVVSMVADVFPFEEVESFAAALQAHGFRFLAARPPGGTPSYDFEEMRKAAQNRSNDEMGVLEEAALAQDDGIPTIVDGRLEPRSEGLDALRSPVFGVVKTHKKNYLHAQGLQILYALEEGQRTPVFELRGGRLPVLSWFVRLSGAGGSTPNWGLVRVEVSARWFEARGPDKDWAFVDRLSRTLYEYRCRELSYARAAVSLHPIVRAERTLGALFSPSGARASRFYRLTRDCKEVRTVSDESDALGTRDVESGGERNGRTETVGSASENGARGPAEPLLIGRVATPPQLEATSDQFYFWVQRGRLVEKTQLVRAESTIGGRVIRFYGVVEEVRRRSRKRDIGEEFDGADGDVEYEPEFKPEGVSYASVSVLRTEPAVLTPPLEHSKVYLGGEGEADASYGFSEMTRSMEVGLLRNGGSDYAGAAKIDLAYLLGDNSGHLNVTGMAGAGTKSSFLMTITKLLLAEARPRPGAAEPLHIVPIILNVKGEDLMWIDRRNRHFGEGQERDWRALGVEPTPFVGAQFYAPTDPGSDGAPTIDGCNATAYSWSLSDVLSAELFPYLFSGDDTASAVMMSLVYDVAAFLTEPDGRRLKPDVPQTWNELLEWMQDQAGRTDANRDVRMHQTGTWRAIYRRLWDLLAEGRSVFPRDAREGAPLRVARAQTSPPQVIDIHDLPTALQRFVVAAIVQQVVAARTGRHAVPGLRYLLVLDELNRFAPRGSTDPITKLLERVATEMRSQGIILLGAQQLASRVSTTIIEMSAVRALGRTGPAELQDRVWQSWDKAARRQASMLRQDEKLIVEPTFRQPMFVKMPFPAWAMRREDIAPTRLADTPEV